ncbi:MAG: MBL fold metallo-hydrolase [Desulfarculaceae bacterium]|nr:MBL fold metallo-hydrolase [Desulfarculaceae bacterium]
MNHSIAAKLKITVVVDNTVDIFLPASGPFGYPLPGPGSILLAEQGMSMWLEVEDTDGKVTRVLYDFGRGEAVLPFNLRALGIDPSQADWLALSHGHIDHYGGLESLARQYELRAPLLAHPQAFGVRGVRRPDGGVAGPWNLESSQVEAALGSVPLMAPGPRELAPGLWLTGGIPHQSSHDVLWKAGLRREGEQWAPDAIDDDQALVVNLRGAGLVVITGCCHAGVFNTLAAARALFPETPLHTLMGGFHLNFLGEEALGKVVDRLAEQGLRYLVPMHCTGALAKQMLRQALGERCPFTSVGMTLSLP